MSFRKVVFWLHLVAGVISGIAIGIMCLTGTALAFEKQVVAWAERDARQVSVIPANATRLTLDELDQRVRSAEPAARPASIIVSADPRATVAYSLGRDDTVFANPYTGQVLRPASTATHDLLHVLVEWHRFLALAGEQRPIGKVINGVCNLAFCALAITGVYLWMPRTWSWRGVRAIALFNWRLTGKARDFNWHNVIGLWSAPILIVLTLTAVPISFRWGNALVYRLVGEVPPAPGAPPASASPGPEITRPRADTPTLSREAQFALVQKEFPAWEQITLRLSSPTRGGSPTRVASAASAPATLTAAPPQASTFVVKLPDTWPRTATTTVALNPYTGEILRRESFADLTTGRQVRTWTRFLHTGEAVGWVGQFIAGLACLGGCLLVYTGFALAWRRFFGKRSTDTVA